MINYADNQSDSRVAIWLDGERRAVSAIRKGAVNEHIAKAWLLKQGYEVFSNISPEGPADLVAVKFDVGETLYVDVKSQSFSFEGEDGERFRERAQKYGIRYLVVDDDGACAWADAPARVDISRILEVARLRQVENAANVVSDELGALASAPIESAMEQLSLSTKKLKIMVRMGLVEHAEVRAGLIDAIVANGLAGNILKDTGELAESVIDFHLATISAE